MSKSEVLRCLRTSSELRICGLSSRSRLPLILGLTGALSFTLMMTTAPKPLFAAFDESAIDPTIDQATSSQNAGTGGRVQSDAANIRVAAKRKKRKRVRYRSKKKKRSNSSMVQRGKLLEGPVQIFVSLREQRLHIYKNGQKLGSSKISSGQRGYRTPTGIFNILQKRRRHYSNIYRGAPMPYMQRITWSGIALHAGHIPNYPASHGCIRLPHHFARSLFSVSEMGAHVVVGQDMVKPSLVSHAGLFQPTRVADLKLNKTFQAAVENSIVGEPHQEALPTPADKEQKDASANSSVYTILHRYIFSSAKAEKKPEPTDDEIRQMSLQLIGFEDKLTRKWAIESRSEQPLRILITRPNGREHTVEIQKLLNSLGFDAGEPDGFVGPQTRKAVRAFQESNELTSDGELTQEVIQKIYTAAGKSPFSKARIYVRQKYKELISAPVILKDPAIPLGTHLFTALQPSADATEIAWNAVTLKERSGRQVVSKKGKNRFPVPTTVKPVRPQEVLQRIIVPEHIKAYISDRLSLGSSMIISDNGMSHETGKYTDFIVLTR